MFVTRIGRVERERAAQVVEARSGALDDFVGRLADTAVSVTDTLINRTPLVIRIREGYARWPSIKGAAVPCVFVFESGSFLCEREIWA